MFAYYQAILINLTYFVNPSVLVLGSYILTHRHRLVETNYASIRA